MSSLLPERYSASTVKDSTILLLHVSCFSQCGSFGHGKISKAILVRLITSLFCSCCCWLSSVVSAALKRPPHVTLCYSLSFPLGHSASFIFVPPFFFFQPCAAYSVWLLVFLTGPEERDKGSIVTCREGRK